VREGPTSRPAGHESQLANLRGRRRVTADRHGRLTDNPYATERRRGSNASDLGCVRAAITTGFHVDHTPSLQLYEDGTWYCYGSCQAGGSIFDFAARAWRINAKGPAFLRLRARLADELGVRAHE
jgi:hypothetical protein